MKVSVVIPALNEEGIVGKTVKLVPKEKLKDAGFETEIIVVDNASEDNTANEAKAAGAKVVDTKITTKIDTGLSDINLRFNYLFFSTTVTFPDEGSDFQSLMNAAIKKVSDKEMLEKFTNILDNTRLNITENYTRYKKYDPKKH